MPRPALAVAVSCDGEALHTSFGDGRTLHTPLPEFLAAATPAQRRNCRVIAFGTAIEWPDLDEVMGVDVILDVDEDEVAILAGAKPVREG